MNISEISRSYATENIGYTYIEDIPSFRPSSGFNNLEEEISTFSDGNDLSELNRSDSEKDNTSKSDLTAKAAGTGVGLLGGYGHALFCPAHGIIPNTFYALGGTGSGIGFKGFDIVNNFKEKATNFMYEKVFMQEGFRDSNLYIDLIHNRQIADSSLYSNTELGVGVATSVAIGFATYKGLKAAVPKIVKSFKDSYNEKPMYLENLIDLKKEK